MSTHVPAALRRLVALLAGNRCEYCLVHERDTYYGCEVEHIIAEKHRGLTIESNLAYACLPCNRHKGTDIASICDKTGKLTPFFNPRLDKWTDHFRLVGTRIVALTDVGEVTVAILALNTYERLLEREELHEAGQYPGSHSTDSP